MISSFSGAYWCVISDYCDSISLQFFFVPVIINLVQLEVRDVIVLFPIALQHQHDKPSSCDLPVFCTVPIQQQTNYTCKQDDVLTGGL